MPGSYTNRPVVLHLLHVILAALSTVAGIAGYSISAVTAEAAPGFTVVVAGRNLFFSMKFVNCDLVHSYLSTMS